MKEYEFKEYELDLKNLECTMCNYFENLIFLKAKLKKYLKKRYKSNLIIKIKIEIILSKNAVILNKLLAIEKLTDAEIKNIAKKLIKKEFKKGKKMRNIFSFYFKNKFYYTHMKDLLQNKYKLKYVNNIKAFEKDYKKIYEQVNKNNKDKKDKQQVYVLNVKVNNNINNIFFMLMFLAYIANKHNIKDFALFVNVNNTELKEALQKLFRIIFYYKNKKIDENAKNANVNNNKDLIFLQTTIKQKDTEIKEILKKFNINFNQIKITKKSLVKVFYKKLINYIDKQNEELEDFEEATKQKVKEIKIDKKELKW